ncbi:MAG: hypothetical protein C4329_12060 [Chitinophagaceae bacterium]
MKPFLFTSVIAFFFSSCSVGKYAIGDNVTSISSLRFIGEYDVPHKMQFKGTTVGGLSSIDFDAKRNVYYLISDDRSDINSARFYTVKIFFDQNKMDSVQFIDVTSMKASNGLPYPNAKQDPYHTPDPEALRYNSKTDQIIWNSEGERIIKKDTIILENPAVTIINRNGNYIDTFPLPDLFKMHATENGPRRNGVFEGLSFANNFKNIFVNLEEPLYEDGPRAGLNDSTGWIRIIKYDVKTKQPIAQYAYQIDPVAYPAETPSAFKINGVPDILYFGNNKILVTERSFSTGRQACVIKVYEADMNGATDISSNKSLKLEAAAKPLSKKLLLDMRSLGIYIDNIEGATFGPTLPNGHRTLIFVSDDNFDSKEKTQFLLFEIIP